MANASSSPSVVVSDDLKHLVQLLSQDVKLGNHVVSIEHLEALSHVLHNIRSLLSDPTSLPQGHDLFRKIGGFETLIDLLQSFAGVSKSSHFNGNTIRAFLVFCNAIFAVVSEALHDNDRNRAHFSVPKSTSRGWDGLQYAIGETGILDTTTGQEDMFGLLFAFALREDSLTSIFKPSQYSAVVGSVRESSNLPEQRLEALGEANAGSGKSPIDPCQTLHNAEVCRVIFNLWCQMPRSQTGISSNSNKSWPPVLASLVALSQASKHNAVAMHDTGLATDVMDYFLDGDLSVHERSQLRDLSLECVKLGLNDLHCLSRLCQAAISLEECSEYLLQAMRHSREVPHFNFDLSTHGFASLELSDLKGPLSCRNGAGGYTFSTWLRIEEFDDACHTTLFGAFDQSQIFFLLIYLDRKHHQLVLQTSIRSSKPSVRFNSIKFFDNVWYHIGIAHEQSTNYAVLFVNGKFVEKLICPFPAPVTFKDATQKARTHVSPIQSFLGIPRDMSPRLGSGVLSSKWSLAATHLLSKTIPTELFFLLCKLGPHYSGILQGNNLGSVQTYAASTAVSMKDEEDSAEKLSFSVLSHSMRFGASSFFAEQDVILSLSPCNLNYNSAFYDSGKLSTTTDAVNDKTSAVVLNGAIFRSANAMIAQTGKAVIAGGLVAYRPIQLADSCWRLCGSVPMALKLLAAAATPDALLRAVQIHFELIKDNWRSSDAVERENGYGILAIMLRSKLGIDNMPDVVKVEYHAESVDTAMRDPLTLELLKLVLENTGFQNIQPHESIIVNAMAYKILVVDCDLWQKSELQTQLLYYEQFVTFGTQSTHRIFNAKRLVRMRIIKKIIDFFRCDTVSADALPSVGRAITTLLQSEHNITADVLRSLALYITYALQHGSLGEPSSSQVLPNVVSQAHLFIPVSYFEAGITVLSTFTDFLCQETSEMAIRKFAKTVTNKWLLHTLTTNELRVVINATRILACLLVSSGASYVSTFEEKTKGFVILRYKLQRWWPHEEIWSACWATFFGIKISFPYQISILDPQHFLGILQDTQRMLYCPQMWCVILAMLEEALNHFHNQALERSDDDLRLLQSVMNFILLLQDKSMVFRDFLQTSKASKDLLRLLLISGTACEVVPNLEDYEARLTGGISQSDREQTVPPSSIFTSLGSETINNILAKQTPSWTPTPDYSRSSFVMINTRSLQGMAELYYMHPLSPRNSTVIESFNIQTSPSREISQALTRSLIEQLLQRRDFSGLGLYIKAPPVSGEQRAALISLVLTEITTKLQNELLIQPSTFRESRVLTNITRFVLQACEAIFEGWLIRVHPLLDFVEQLLNYLNFQDVKSVESIKVYNLASSTLRRVYRRVYILQLFQYHRGMHNAIEIDLLSNLLTSPQSQRSILESVDQDEVCQRALSCLLYHITIRSPIEVIRLASLFLWRRLLQRIPHNILLANTPSVDDSSILQILHNIMVSEDERTFDWICERHLQLDINFSIDSMTELILEENKASQKSSILRQRRRAEKLNQFHLEELADEHTLTEHSISTIVWNRDIHTSELLKHIRTCQDQKENQVFLKQSFRRINTQIIQGHIFSPTLLHTMWSLDEAEGHDRMHLRIVPINYEKDQTYQSKRARQHSRSTAMNRTIEPATLMQEQPNVKPIEAPDAPPRKVSSSFHQPPMQHLLLGEEDFEIVNAPINSSREKTVEVSRKVARSLQRAEQVKVIYNVSRIRGVEAFESLLIVGSHNLYLLGGLFQCVNEQIVTIVQAPEEERDHYIRVISGHEPSLSTDEGQIKAQQDQRHWSWSQILYISKRQFLFRDVALEIFFQDGRSFLITTITVNLRNELYAKLSDYARGPSDKNEEDSWRVNQFQTNKTLQQTVGERFATVFNFASTPPETARWLRREISNFQYLNHVNSVAGRTTNDLTQYPVFPWIIADYSSDALDLSNPKVYRDLSKPMGCQHPGRENAFKERYRALANMDEIENPPFHYGTHYSSAMIVTSYLIRLAPFVRSYLLLQGGCFDHAARLFNSVGRAWLSASQDSMTDVRELTPEFFYLPEFLVNINKFEIGTNEDGGEVINHVQLPPWAKDDPHIFIDMQKKALESDYVSQNLHLWIDLIFGSKQRGDAAIVSTNVYHHLSYPGRNLDEIMDPLEQRATISVIHNFGQTPRQVFNKPHEQRHTSNLNLIRHRALLETLLQEPKMIYKASSQISRLFFSQKRQRLMSSGPYEVHMPPHHNIKVEWNLNHASIRLLSTQNNKELALFEQLHQGKISTILFADPTTMITASDDTTVSVWDLKTSTTGIFELQLRATLFGHRHPITTVRLAVSLSTMISCSIGGQVLLWDINNYTMIRELKVANTINHVAINGTTGRILLCSTRRLFIFTINGRLLIDQLLSTDDQGSITSCAFASERISSLFSCDIIITGHANSTIILWAIGYSDEGVWNLSIIKSLRQTAPNGSVGMPYTSAVTSLLSKGDLLYTGNDDGLIFSF